MIGPVRPWLVAALALLVNAQAARAGLLLSFVFDQSNYVVAPNGTVDVGIFLRQTGTPAAGETNVLGGFGAVGMTGTGVRISFPTGPNDAQVLSTANITGNPAFDNFGFDPFSAVDANSALLSQATSGSPVFGSAVGPNVYDLFLGTFTFTAGAVPGTVTQIGASIPLFQNSNDNVAATTPFPTSLLNITDGSATITVQGSSVTTAVPAPGSLVLGLLGAFAISARACVKKRLQTAKFAGKAKGAA